MSAPIPTTADRFTAIDTVLALTALAWLTATDLIAWFEEQWILGAILALTPLIAILLALVFRLARALWRRRWRRVGSIAVALSLLVAVDAAFQSLGGDDRLRFETQRDRWEALVKTQAHGTAPRLAAFPWRDSGGAGVTNTFDYLVYDESDEIARPVRARTSPWVARAQAPLLRSWLEHERDEPRSTAVRHVTGHFYIAEESYP